MMEEIIYRKATVDDCRELSILKRIDVIKKNGSENACDHNGHRKELVEELADVLMYYNDVLLCYGITAEELKKAYTEKFNKNLKRW